MGILHRTLIEMEVSERRTGVEFEGTLFSKDFFCYYFYTYADSNLSFVAFPPSSAGGGAPAFEG
jgi:hypothetical protein